jgi:hypothetical protein
MNRLVAWCLLAALSGVAMADDFTGTWSGAFVIHFADGRVENDTAWLVLQQSGDAVTGTVGPAADKQGPIREVSKSGNTLRFVADSSQGKTLQFVLKRDGETLAGEANGDIGDDRVRVVVSATRRTTTAATWAPDALREKMLALDTAMFDSFNKCADPAEFRKHAAYFAKDVEFYHDLGGVTLGVDKLMEQTRQNVCGKFRRELDVASFRVFPIPGYGAMTFGVHRFCHTPTTCEGAGDFATVWRETNGQWQVTRALSYAHRSLEAPASLK